MASLARTPARLGSPGAAPLVARPPSLSSRWHLPLNRRALLGAAPSACPSIFRQASPSEEDPSSAQGSASVGQSRQLHISRAAAHSRQPGEEWRPESPPAHAAPSAHSQAALMRELEAVNTAVAVNGAIFAAKLGVWTLTGSGALLAEALHSAADVMNQLLLRAGVHSSRRAPTKEHPYGFHKEKYIYALMSAVGIFCLGAGASVLHGFQSLFDPPHLDHMALSLGVLAASGLGEAYSLTVALQGIRASAAEQGLTVWEYVRRGRDPTTLAVFAEDAGAVAGLAVAGAATAAAWSTGRAVFDALGSIAIGSLMAAIAVFLIRSNMAFLRGQAMEPDLHGRVVRHLQADPLVTSVIDAKSEAVGDGVYRFKAEIQWSGDAVVERFLAREGRRAGLRDRVRRIALAEEAGQAAPLVLGPEVFPPSHASEASADALDTAMAEFGRGVIHTVGEEIDRLEGELKSLVPGLVYVDLETDKGRAEKEGWAADARS